MEISLIIAYHRCRLLGQPLPTPRSEIAGAALNGKVYIIGGFDESKQSTTTVEVYDPIADK